MGIQLLDYGSAAALLGLQPITLRKWVSAKKIPHIKVGSRAVRFDESELRDWINSHRVPAEVSQ